MEGLTRGCGRARLVCMTKWEYFTAPLMVHNTKAILDNFGKQGWELVQVVSMPAAGGAAPTTGAEIVAAPSVNLVGYFKRPLESE